jgi:cell division protein FtsQ
MPAVVRGGRRQSSKPAPKKTAKAFPAQASQRGGGKVPAGKLHALDRVGLPAGAVALPVGALIAIFAGVFAFTDERSGAISRTVADAIDQRLADAGLRLEKVHVEGASPAALAAIKAKLALYRGEPMAGLDLAEMRSAVESVGWVRQAKVLRLFPDTLVIDVDERQRLAVWQHEGKVDIVDATGVAIPDADPNRFSDLPLVVGPGANTAAAEILPLVRQRPRLMDRIEALVRVDGRRWDLRLKDGSLIQLPATGVDSALIQLDQLDRRDRLLELGFARIDLRDPEMIAVRPREAAQADAAGE